MASLVPGQKIETYSNSLPLPHILNYESGALPEV